MPEVNCSNCDKVFNKKTKEINRSKTGKHFCCPECVKEHFKNPFNTPGYKQGKYVECAACGKETYKIPSDIKEKNFCSHKCLGVWRSRNAVGEAAHNYKNALNNYTCEFCGKEFTGYHKDRKFCSTECKGKNQHKRKEIKCHSCGKMHVRPNSYIKWQKLRGRKRNFCSKECFTAYNTKESHPHWIKDRTKLKDPKKSLRWSCEMKQWRKEVYKRDNYTCLMCGARSKAGTAVVLNCHHIKPFISNPDLRFDINNGATLCESCHKKTYKKEHLYENLLGAIIDADMRNNGNNSIKGFVRHT